jgi:OPA family sugar phosphate sensor protein UhpC-like MFS transporter
MYWPSKAQFQTLGWIYFAYVMCYLVRKNYPMILPSLNEKGLLSQNQAGIVASVFEVVVALVKFFCGVYVDGSASPGMLLVQCLGVAGISCVGMQLVFWIFTDATQGFVRLFLVAMFWSFNGAGQAVAWPALARVFMAWFPDAATRGTWYSILATNQNLGGVLAPLIYPPLMAMYGWEIALLGPALLTLMYAGMMRMSLQSQPPSIKPNATAPVPGRDSTGISNNESMVQSTTTNSNSNSNTNININTNHTTTATTTTTTKPLATTKKTKPGFYETFTYLMRMKPFVWLCVAYIPVMLIRQSLINWTAVIFDDSGMTLFEAGSCISALEFGGFVGGLTGGYLSDQWFRGRRGPIMVIFSLLCVPLALALQFGLTTQMGAMGVSKLVLLQVVFFLTGFASFPPHSLIGLMSREMSPVDMRSTAGCLAKASGQIGAAAAGWPLQALAQRAGWSCIGYTNAVAGLLAAMAFLPLWSLTARDNKEK